MEGIAGGMGVRGGIGVPRCRKCGQVANTLVYSDLLLVVLFIRERKRRQMEGTSTGPLALQR